MGLDLKEHSAEPPDTEQCAVVLRAKGISI